MCFQIKNKFNLKTLPRRALKVMNKIVSKNFKAWNDALQTGDEKIVANLYAKNASFLPTLSPNFVVANELLVQDYFKHFLNNHPFGRIVREHVVSFGWSFTTGYSHAGDYDFELGDAGRRYVVHARFIFVWKKIKGEWKIVQHHSSVRPEQR